MAAEQAYADGDHDKAARALEQAAVGSPQETLEAAERYAIACDTAGDLDAALTYILVTLGLPGDPELPELEQADHLRVTGSLGRARARYEQLTDHQDLGVNLVAFSRLVRLRFDSGDRPAVYALLRSRLGLVYFGGNAPERARATLRAAAESGVPTALFTLGRVLLWSDEIEEGRDVLHRLATLDSGLGCRALVLVGKTFKDPELARETYLRALDHPGEPDEASRAQARMYLGSLAKKARDWPEARRWYQEVLDTGPFQNALAAAHLGEIAYWLDEPDDVIRNYERTLATGTENADLIGEAAYRLGETHHSRGDLSAAKECLRRATRSGSASFATQAADLLDELER